MQTIQEKQYKFLESRLDLLYRSKFESSFRVTRGTFTYILDILIPYLQRMTIFHSRMGIGDYIHTAAELSGVGGSSVCNIVLEASKLMTEVMWNVAVHFTATPERSYINLINDFGKLWQFPFCFRATDGCLIPIKCPPRDQESTKEYRNLPFYIVIL